MRIEFYEKGSRTMIFRVHDEFCPRVGDYIIFPSNSAARVVSVNIDYKTMGDKATAVVLVRRINESS